MPRVLVDSGNFTDNPTPQGFARTAALLTGMERLGYSVVNVGERDVRQGYEQFASMTGGHKLQFVSANLVRQDRGEPVLRPWIVLDAKSPSGAKSRKVGIIGVLRFNPLFRQPGPEGSELAIVNPLEPVKRAVAELERSGVDLIVLLAAMHRDDAARIAQEVPQINFVVGSYGGHYTELEDRVQQNAWLLYSGNQGKRLGETRVWIGGADRPARAPQTRLHFLNRMYPVSQPMLDFVNSVPAAPPEDVQPVVGAGASAPGPYAGPQACRTCHAAEHADWQSSKHATALATLEPQKATTRPDCLGCHATAAGLAGGFRNAQETPDLAAVTCESCHGAGREHIADPARSYGAIGVSSCTVCHNPANSPKFDYYSYVGRVNHRAAKR